MKNVNMIRSAIVLSVLAALLGGCSGGGGFDQVRSTFGDSGASARVQLREAAVAKYEPTALLAAAHNEGQAKVDVNARREIQPWWLEEYNGVSIKTIDGVALSSTVSKYKDLAKNRPAAGTDAEQLWLEAMAGHVAMFRAQADSLEVIADHYEQNGTAAAMSEQQLATAISQIRERAEAIRAYEVSFQTAPVTASLEPGNARTVVATRNDSSNSPSISQRDVRDGSRAVSAATSGNLVQAATTGARVVFPN